MNIIQSCKESNPLAIPPPTSFSFVHGKRPLLYKHFVFNTPTSTTAAHLPEKYIKKESVNQCNSNRHIYHSPSTTASSAINDTSSKLKRKKSLTRRNAKAYLTGTRGNQFLAREAEKEALHPECYDDKVVKSKQRSSNVPSCY